MTMAYNPDGTIDQINGAAAAAASITVPPAVLATGAGALTYNLDMTISPNTAAPSASPS
jgi:hypothetical protein